MLSLVPVSLKDANAFVAEHHRHHKPTRGHKFSIGCASGGLLAANAGQVSAAPLLIFTRRK